MSDVDLTAGLLDDCSNFVVVTPELKIRAAKDQKEHFEVFSAPERTYLIVTAIHKDKTRNVVNRLSCKKGVPIMGYVFDTQSDTYHIECCDYLHLGYVPISFMAKMPGTGWTFRVPMCETVIKKFMTTLQKKELRNFKNHFKLEDHSIEFIQMIDPN